MSTGKLPVATCYQGWSRRPLEVETLTIKTTTRCTIDDSPGARQGVRITNRQGLKSVFVHLEARSSNGEIDFLSNRWIPDIDVQTHKVEGFDILQAHRNPSQQDDRIIIDVYYSDTPLNMNSRPNSMPSKVAHWDTLNPKINLTP